MSSPDDFADLRPEPLDPETCAYRGQLYRRHESWGEHPVCVRCGRATTEEEFLMPTHTSDCRCAICRPGG